jgi:predicted TIM-barrel fold metal-dependent hydrolase
MSSRLHIVDADAHVNPPPTFWVDYLPNNLKEFAPKLEHGEDADYVVFEGNRRKVNLIAAQAGRKHSEFKMEGRLSDARKGGWMPGERLADMDRDGMDVAVLFGGGPLGTSNDDLYMASFDAYNRWLADFVSYDPARLCGVGMVPMRDVEQTAQMMRDLAKAGFTTINIPAFPQSKEKMSVGGFQAQAIALTGSPDSGRAYDDPEFDLIWKTAVELDMTLTMHLGARVPRFTTPAKLLIDLPMSKVAMAEPVATMIYGAVFQRFPALRLAIVESGVGWLAWFAGYMDATWKKQRFWTNSPLTEPPSFYMDQNVYGSFIDEEVGIQLRHVTGGKNIMWSSDYPHSETTYPDSLAVIERIFKGVPEADKAEIIGGRAKRVFRTGDGWAKPVAKEAAE